MHTFKFFISILIFYSVITHASAQQYDCQPCRAKVGTFFDSEYQFHVSENQINFFRLGSNSKPAYDFACQRCCDHFNKLFQSKFLHKYDKTTTGIFKLTIARKIMYVKECLEIPMATIDVNSMSKKEQEQLKELVNAKK